MSAQIAANSTYGMRGTTRSRLWAASLLPSCQVLSEPAGQPRPGGRPAGRRHGGADAQDCPPSPRQVIAAAHARVRPQKQDRQGCEQAQAAERHACPCLDATGALCGAPGLVSVFWLRVLQEDRVDYRLLALVSPGWVVA
jgi:hypothetical protein